MQNDRLQDKALKTKSDSPISKQILEMDGDIEGLFNSIGKLEDSIRDVLVSSTPEEAKETTSESPEMSNLEMQLSEKTLKIKRARKTIYSIIERVTI